MIIVTGATGLLGSRIVDHLLKRVPADQIGVSVREPAKVAQLADQGVSVRAGDFSDPASLPSAFAGASQILLVSVDTFGDAGQAQHRTAIAAAAAAGAQRVLYTSHMGVHPDSLFAATRDHAVTEQALASSGIAFTALRNGFYASTVPLLIGNATRTGQLIAPADGPVSWTTHDDLAEAAAVALTEPGRLDGLAPALTAAESLDLADVAALLSELTGRRIERVTVSDEDWTNDLLARGVPAERADALQGMFRAARRGEFAAVDPTLRRMLGRPPQRMREVLASHLTH